MSIIQAAAMATIATLFVSTATLGYMVYVDQSETEETMPASCVYIERV